MCIVQDNVLVLFNFINVSTLLDGRHKGSPDCTNKIAKALSKF